MKKCAFALLCSSVLISAARAADLGPACKAPFAPVRVSTWTGLYMGASVGYGWGTTSLSGVVIGAVLESDMKPKGVNGGFQLGYNYQVGSAVFGGVSGFQ